MKATIERATLLKSLSHVQSVVERRNTIPILSNVLIEKSGDALSFLATDIEIQIVSRSALEQAGDTKGVTVGARKLVDILRALPEGEVTLTTQDKRLHANPGGHAAVPKSELKASREFLARKLGAPMHPELGMGLLSTLSNLLLTIL